MGIILGIVLVLSGSLCIFLHCKDIQDQKKLENGGDTTTNTTKRQAKPKLMTKYTRNQKRETDANIKRKLTDDIDNLQGNLELTENKNMKFQTITPETDKNMEMETDKNVKRENAKNIKPGNGKKVKRGNGKKIKRENGKKIKAGNKKIKRENGKNIKPENGKNIKPENAKMIKVENGKNTKGGNGKNIKVGDGGVGV